jgi:hypothetical protein
MARYWHGEAAGSPRHLLSPHWRPGTICRVTLLLGSKERFALELGEEHGGLRRVDAWAAGQWLTCDDNMAYVPQLKPTLQLDHVRLDAIRDSPIPFPGLSPTATHRRLLADESGLRESWRFLDWGPTTDNVLAHLLPDRGHLVMTVGFWREEHLRHHPEHAGTVFAAEIEAEELADILQGAVAALDRAQASAESRAAE